MLPILAGPLSGRWWAPGSGGKPGRFYLGTYESDQTPLFCDHVRPGQTVLDLGANVGYYTLLAAELVGPSGTVVAFEPEPLNAAYLRRHVEVNRLPQVDVLQHAVGRAAGTLRFTRGKGRGRGHLHDEGELEVEVVTLDEVVEARSLTPNCLKIDVEGAEADVLEGGRGVLEEHRPVLFLATHGRDVHARCISLLSESGYQVECIDDRPMPEARKLLALPAEG